jgi:hypothetical protein
MKNTYSWKVRGHQGDHQQMSAPLFSVFLRQNLGLKVHGWLYLADSRKLLMVIGLGLIDSQAQ